MERKRTRFHLLRWLVVMLTCVSVSMSEEEVVAEADEMAKKIEEESKKVDAQSDAMLKAIESKEKSVDDADQEKKFDEASKRVDNVMDIGEQAVEEKANKAEERASDAERRVEELGRQIEGGSKNKKRSTITKQAGMKSNTKRRDSVMYNVEPSQEMTVGQEINSALREGDRLSEAVYNYDKMKNEDQNINTANQGVTSGNLQNNLYNGINYLTLRTNQGDSNHGFMSNGNFHNNFNKNFNYLTSRAEEITPAFLKGYYIPPREYFSQKSDNLFDLQNKLKTHKENDFKNMYEDQMEKLTSRDDQTNNSEDNEDVEADSGGSVDNYHNPNKKKKEEKEKGEKDQKQLDDNVDNNHKPNKKKKEKGDQEKEKDQKTLDDNVEGSVEDLEVDDTPIKNKQRPKDGKDTTIQDDIQSVINDVRSQENLPASPTKEPSIFSQQKQHHHNSSIKESKNLFENVEFDINQQIKEQEDAKKAEQKDLNVLGSSLQLLSSSSSPNQPIDPEMILRWPSLAKNYGRINEKQKISLISGPEVEFLQTQYQMPPDDVVTDALQERQKRQTRLKLKTILVHKRNK